MLGKLAPLSVPAYQLQNYFVNSKTFKLTSSASKRKKVTYFKENASLKFVLVMNVSCVELENHFLTETYPNSLILEAMKIKHFKTG